ncbi:MAG: hypothetical protein Q8K99_07310 [Actinomycetota bacterium]|nr:hypothetical protein [Actinomycetota bacterium]
MQLKIQRSQREGGVMSKTVIFCIDARVEFTAAEQASITRYKLQKQVIYNSEASKKHLDSAAGYQAGNSLGGNLRSLASVAMAAMNLNISIESLQRGQHVECKSLDELLGAEQAIMDACRNLRGYLDTAATFDGREVLIDFNTDEPHVVATATAPAPMLVAPSATTAQAAPQPALEADATHHRTADETAGLRPDPHVGMGGNAGAMTQEFSIEPFVRWWQRLSGGQKVGVVVGTLFILFLLSQCMG